MPRKKKKPFNRLPNGFGSIKKLSGNRRKPFAVYAPSRLVHGVMFPGELLECVETWEQGYERLVLYKTNKEWERKKKKEKLYTFAEVYELFYREKYELSLKKYSDSSKNSTNAAYKHCEPLYDMVFSEIDYDDLQNCIDGCIGQLKHASLELIKNLYRGMYAYALKHNITDTDYSSYVEIRIADDDEKGVPFTEQDLVKLWQSDLPAANAAIILCYSGWRISEFVNIEIDFENQVFKGGMKTQAGKNRIVPIHPSILPRVRLYADNPITYPPTFRNNLYTALERLKIEKHTPHDCRHTFSWLCDKYGVDPLSKKIMLGHSLGTGVTDAVYGHRTTEELRSEIEKIAIIDHAANFSE